MARRSVFLLVLAGSVLAAPGCSCRAWYEGLQLRQRQQCYQLEGEREVQDCLSRAGGMSYDDYQRLRREAPP